MKRMAACLLFVALATPALLASAFAAATAGQAASARAMAGQAAATTMAGQAPRRLTVAQTRRAFVAAVNVGAVDVLELLLAEDAVLRMDAKATNRFFQGSAFASPSVNRVEGRDAVIAFLAGAFASRGMALVAQQSEQSDVVASESGRVQLQRGGVIANDGDYRLALVRADDGWRITDVRLESGAKPSSPTFSIPPVPRRKPAQPPQPPPRREAVPPGFGVVPIAAARLE